MEPSTDPVGPHASQHRSQRDHCEISQADGVSAMRAHCPQLQRSV